MVNHAAKLGSQGFRPWHQIHWLHERDFNFKKPHETVRRHRQTRDRDLNAPDESLRIRGALKWHFVSILTPIACSTLTDVCPRSLHRGRNIYVCQSFAGLNFRAGGTRLYALDNKLAIVVLCLAKSRNTFDRNCNAQASQLANSIYTYVDIPEVFSKDLPHGSELSWTHLNHTEPKSPNTMSLNTKADSKQPGFMWALRKRNRGIRDRTADSEWGTKLRVARCGALQWI
ncbi:hypothetical protein AG1IA_04420 [Rhizoctonia solani AG-1 IA]|uniref:Uncharacterized protein n=1 Tax=Thanatephorus cucumeris (strain AG1-IA) TaxID=983506 RepID=L8WXP0_THACA|nr:hypothetical protein AG1IA_04420 [Rhizoctonia solani AG-1 IA]